MEAFLWLIFFLILFFFFFWSPEFERVYIKFYGIYVSFFFFCYKHLTLSLEFWGNSTGMCGVWKSGKSVLGGAHFGKIVRGVNCEVSTSPTSGIWLSHSSPSPCYGIHRACLPEHPRNSHIQLNVYQVLFFHPPSHFPTPNSTTLLWRYGKCVNDSTFMKTPLKLSVHSLRE